MSDKHTEMVLEWIETSLQHLAHESHKTREELRLVREALELMIQFLGHRHQHNHYPRSTGITITTQ